MKHTLLQVPEHGFTLFGKNLRNLAVKPFLYVPIKVIERASERPAERFADNRFARTHITDKNDALHDQFTLYGVAARGVPVCQLQQR